jgi:hypothetical protein
MPAKRMTKRQLEKAAALKAKWDAVKVRRAEWRQHCVEFREAERLRKEAVCRPRPSNSGEGSAL